MTMTGKLYIIIDSITITFMSTDLYSPSRNKPVESITFTCL